MFPDESREMQEKIKEKKNVNEYGLYKNKREEESCRFCMHVPNKL